MTHPTSVSALVRHHRVAAGLSQEALSEKAGVSVRGLSDLERGRSRAPRLDTLNRLSEALGLDDAQRLALVQASGHLGADDQQEAASEAYPAPKAPASAVLKPNLPTYLTSLVGRDAEVTEVRGLLEQCTTRLVTLTGPGGVGKTRLAATVASDLSDAYPDGVIYIELASISDPDLVLSLIAQSLGIGERGDQSVLFDRVVLALREGRRLLVLDNFEHILSAASLLSDLLRETNDLYMLVTSRALLRLSCEQVFTVPPLPLPSRSELSTSETATRWPAVQLFVLRAQAVQPNLHVTPENFESILGICRELDGLPLALELAAARVNVLPPATLYARLQHRLSLLTSGRRDAPNRHRGLREAIAWSYDLLSAEEQRLFRWLGVFAGGFSLSMVETVCGERSERSEPGASDDVLDGIAALVEHSLVQPQAQPGPDNEPRFRLLETIREHALEQLTAAGEAQAARRRHAVACLDLAEAAERHLLSPQRGTWLPRLDADLDNIRAAIAWSVSPDGDPEIGLRLVGSLSWFWYLRGHLHEGSRVAEQAVHLSSDSVPESAQARCLMAIGGTAVMLGEAARAQPHLERCCAIFRATGDWRLAPALGLLGIAETSLGEPTRALESFSEGVVHARVMGHTWLEAYFLTNQGAATLLLGDEATAGEMYRASLRLFEDIDDPWGRGIALRGLANLALRQQDFATAQELFEAAVPSFRDTGDIRGLAQALIRLGKAAMYAGRVDYAAETWCEALRHWRDLGIWGGVVRCLTGLAWVAATRGAMERSTRLYAAVDRYAKSLDVVFPKADVAGIERTVKLLRDSLGEERFATAWSRGAALTLEQAADEALNAGSAA
jgi:predicted ATPase/transcriptional regulator with XRE-family HTH domain